MLVTSYCCGLSFFLILVVAFVYVFIVGSVLELLRAP